ncbi:MAG: hypothetical protein M9916_08250 [Crocinitomicaceae bacterium]|nr:hypothetical protein [Crocinitomicaceae bacterium]
MNEKDNIKDLFSEKLGNLETPVNPELWSSIASQVGISATTTSSIASAGMSLATKAIIGIAAASVIGLGAYFLTTEKEQPIEQKQPVQVAKQSVDTSNEVAATSSNEEQKTAKNTVEKPSQQTIEQSTTVSTASIAEKHSIDPILTDNTTFVSKPNMLNSEKKSTSSTNVTAKQEAPETTQKTAPVADKNSQPTTETPTPVEKPKTQPTFELTNLPNIYVLNASGYFSIGYTGEYKDFQFTLMDENSNVVFTSNQPDFMWKGTDMHNNVIQPGKYIYIVTVKDANGKSINKYQSLTIINQ